MKAYFLFFFITIFRSTSQFFFSVKPKSKECFESHVVKDEKYSGKYYIAGENEESNAMSIRDSKKQLIWESINKKEANFVIQVAEDGIFHVCFENNDNKYITITYNLFDESEHNNLVSSQSIQDMNTNIHEVRRKIDIIHSDLRNSVVRRKVHLDSKIFI